MYQKLIITIPIVLGLVIGSVSATTLVAYFGETGYMQENTEVASYSTIRNAAGDAVGRTGSTDYTYLQANSAGTAFNEFDRAGYCVDTSAIGSGSTITSAKISLNVYQKWNFLGSPTYAFTGFSPANPSAIAAGDFDAFSDTPLSGALAYADITPDSYTNWTLNSDGLAYISKTGTTCVMLRDSWDISNSFGGTLQNGYSGLRILSNDSSSGKPLITIEYTTGGGADTTPPASITNLANSTTSSTINWTWTNPADADFNNTVIYKDGTWLKNASNSTAYDLWSGLSANTLYTFSSYTCDIVGNCNTTWVNQSATTLPNAPVADFTCSPTEFEAYSLTTCTDLSTNTPTSWNWSFGDGSYSNYKNTSHEYSAAGKYSINLTVSNAGGNDYEYKQDYINVSEQAVSNWVQVADQLNSQNEIETLIKYDDGTGEAIYGGTYGGGRLFKYNATTGGWVQVADQLNSQIGILSSAIYNDGTGEAIYGGTYGGRLFKYNATTGGWVQVATKLNSQTMTRSLTTYDDGTGEAIYGGTYNGGRLFKYTPTTGGWVQVATKLNSQIYILSLTTYNDGTGEAIYGSTGVGGRLFKYNATTGGWVQVADQLNSQIWVYSIIKYNDGTGEAIFGGTGTGGRLFKYNATTGGWVQVATQLNSQSDIYSLTTYDDGTGEAIFGGTGTGGRLFKYNATTGGWVQAASKLKSQTAIISLTTYDDGTGEAIFGGTYDMGRLYKYNVTYGGGGDIIPPASITDLANSTTSSTINWTWTNPADADFNNTVIYKDGTWLKNVSNSTTYDLWEGLDELTGYTISTKTCDIVGNCNVSWVNQTATTLKIAPVAGFSANVTTGIAPQAVQFTDESTDTPTNWTWNFGDGDISYDQNPIHIYISTGVYSVNLTVENAGGPDYEYKPDYINITPPAPVTDFTGTPTSGETPLTVTFTDSSTNAPTNWYWDFGDGNTTNNTHQNPVHTYWAVGTYDVKLKATNDGGSKWQNKTGYITVNDLTSPSSITGLTNTTTTNSINWTWTNPADADFNHTVIYKDGTWLKNASNSTAYDLWSGLSANTLYTFSSYTCDIVGNCNTTWVNQSATTLPNAPVADFTGTPTSGYANLVVSFTDESINEPTSWYWDFGDGDNTNNTQQNPIHTYYTHGVYSVNLTATNAGGSNAFARNAYITVNAPVAEFSGTPTSGTKPLEVAFTDLTSGTPTTWNWSFGDGGYSDNKNTTHIYTSSGVYSVILAIIDEGGNIDTETKLNYISVTSPPPVAEFTCSPTEFIVFNSTTCTDESTNDPTSWNWSFGDGSYSASQNPMHEYTIAGLYNVALTVTNDAGSDTKTRNGYINVTNAPASAPVAAFTANKTSGNIPLAIKFTDGSINTPTSWGWDFGDGNISYEQNPVHVYESVGIFSVNLTVTNDIGTDYEYKSNYITTTNETPTPTPTTPPTPTITTIPTTGTPDPQAITHINANVGETWITWEWVWNETNKTPLIYIDGVELQNTAGDSITITGLDPRSDHTMELYVKEDNSLVKTSNVTTLPAVFDIIMYFIFSIVATTVGLIATSNQKIKLLFAVIGLVTSLYALNLAYSSWFLLPAIPAIYAGTVIALTLYEMSQTEGYFRW